MNEWRAAPSDRPARIAVLDDYMGAAPGLADWSQFQSRAELSFIEEAIAPGDLAARLRDFDAICLLRERTAIDADLLRQLPNLKAIVATGRENRTLDHRTAQELGIAVMTTTGSGNGVYATVELAWGLIFSLMRFLPQESTAMREGLWQTRLGSAVYGRTLGLIGLGRLGARMALAGRAFGMNVIAWSPNLTADRAEAAGATLADKATLLSEADIVSLHLVLGPSTRGILAQADLRAMRPDALLINTARGPLVDQGALVEALQDGGIRGAGIDVYDQEPLPAEHPLRRQHNVLLTPHLGYSVRETFERFYGETAENLRSWLDGQPIRLIEPDRKER